MVTERPLSALLSQVLVAFTVEFDNEFERQMRDAGHPGAMLSLTVWSNLMRFVGEAGISVRDLAKQSQAPLDGLKSQLGCLERWKFIVLQPGVRDGWGSGRGIRTDWTVRLTSRGRAACEVWPPLFGEIERRWENRFGKDEIDQLRQALQSIADLESKDSPLPDLMARVLQAFEAEFNRESAAPLVCCANTLRVLGENPTRLTDLPRLTGISPETCGIGWQIKPHVVVTAGKVARLSPRGVIVQQDYMRLLKEIEARWRERFGAHAVAQLRESLLRLFEGPLAEGLVPGEGTLRAGVQAPALGRRDVGPAAIQRMRDMVAQTEAFIRDPAGSLPHFPAWDMNRGFGP